MTSYSDRLSCLVIIVRSVFINNNFVNRNKRLEIVMKLWWFTIIYDVKKDGRNNYRPFNESLKLAIDNNQSSPPSPEPGTIPPSMEKILSAYWLHPKAVLYAFTLPAGTYIG